MIWKNFYNSVFIAFVSKSSCTNLEKYTDRHEKLYLNHSVVYFTKFFCIIIAINLFLKSTVELCVIITVLLLPVILVFNTTFVIFDYFLVFFPPCRHHQPIISQLFFLFLLTFKCLFLVHFLIFNFKSFYFFESVIIFNGETCEFLTVFSW